MKKTTIVCLLVGCLLLVGCKEVKGEIIVKTYNEIEYTEGVYNDKNWKNKIEPANNIAIPDVETAVNIANVIVDSHKKEGLLSNYVPQSIFYDTKDKIWIISYWEESNEPILGACFTIAIRAKNAEVIKMWVGE